MRAGPSDRESPPKILRRGHRLHPAPHGDPALRASLGILVILLAAGAIDEAHGLTMTKVKRRLSRLWIEPVLVGVPSAHERSISNPYYRAINDIPIKNELFIPLMKEGLIEERVHCDPVGESYYYFITQKGIDRIPGLTAEWMASGETPCASQPPADRSR